jgi:hypothetical protein
MTGFWFHVSTLNRLAATQISALQSYSSLRLLSLILHSTLIAIHLLLIAIWAKGLEQRLVFSLDNQSIVSLIITAISTTFGTVRISISSDQASELYPRFIRHRLYP